MVRGREGNVPLLPQVAAEAAAFALRSGTLRGGGAGMLLLLGLGLQ